MGNGVITLASPVGPNETFARLLANVTSRGLKVFATIDHGLAAEQVGLQMKPACLLIFGSPRSGTPLMRLAPTLAIDLPLKALVWEDDEGETWLSYNDPTWLARRHSPAGPDAPELHAMAQALFDIAQDTLRPVWP